MNLIRAGGLLLLLNGATMALEEPQFDVVRRADDYEIRLYASHLVVEVDVYGDLDEAGNPAFGILAGYIFGDNGSAEKMAMTAPVTSTELSTAGANYPYAFVMERAYTMETPAAAQRPKNPAAGDAVADHGCAPVQRALDRGQV